MPDKFYLFVFDEVQESEVELFVDLEKAKCTLKEALESGTEEGVNWNDDGSACLYEITFVDEKFVCKLLGANIDGEVEWHN